ncbi:hypothetical protein LTR17_013250 [Elasticomyces elasticus]|nr:hypothetical protein LTR17_013250 [Elasticomyces elasticus]
MEATSRLLGGALDTLNAIANLALTRSNQSRWNEAEELQVKVMEARLKLLGKGHRDTISVMNDLALTFSEQGRLNDVEELQYKVADPTARASEETVRTHSQPSPILRGFCKIKADRSRQKCDSGRFGTTEMDKVLFCGNAVYRSFERFGTNVQLDDEQGMKKWYTWALTGLGSPITWM